MLKRDFKRLYRKILSAFQSIYIEKDFAGKHPGKIIIKLLICESEVGRIPFRVIFQAESNATVKFGTRCFWDLQAEVA